ncbi:dihydroneopterin aldolase [Maliponia aquimaris]|uniref:dihydroneopterin aldolase n=1 Tax=Maliponia aquimaris TaxID=1673631 RepID=A0A238L4V9_9RHOB|nr:dihydroneopterin aldolase [Maliponia aquimaris]SMX49432.1 bifunctional dihydroneopterin aldolase/dihydroneopterin triphosphate 2'-epimerase [Maliponia aquimaris]
MASDIRLAFSHPSERSIATAGDTPHDRISVRDMVVEADIGAFQAERGHKQRLRFNVVVEVIPFTGPRDDDVDRILSYDRVTEAITHELAAERLNLLETLAERVAERILLEPQALRTFVRIEKLDRGPGALGVEIVRSRRDVAGHLDAMAQEMASARPHPRVVYLSNAAIADPRLSDWLDALEAQPAPLILCVGRPDAAAPQTGHRMTQRRIDLLSIEQNGWCLAARDARAKVVVTRTELDWAMKNGQICVWAPSKIVLDATQGPRAQPGDSVALAAWFAGEMEARELLVIGEDLPETPPVAARAVHPGDALF